MATALVLVTWMGTMVMPVSNSTSCYLIGRQFQREFDTPETPVTFYCVEVEL